MRERNVDLNEVLARSHSGGFPHALLTVDQLLELSELCLARGMVIHTAEAIAVTMEAEQLCLEYSLLNDPEGGWAPTWPERAQRSHREILELAALVRQQPRTIQFEVWLDGP
jgi:hypothetical protein